MTTISQISWINLSKQVNKVLPKSYFEDTLTRGVAYGTAQHVLKNNFTLLKLPVGYGKTVISMQVAQAISNLHGKSLQIMVIAPKAKRLDKSFHEAIKSTRNYFGADLQVLPINGEEIGTFAGLNVMATKKPKMWKTFLNALYEKPTLLILDETHMMIRNATSKASRLLRKIQKQVSKHDSSIKILGLTATPFDTSVIDAVGYLVLNGNYHSRTAFYNKEVVGYSTAHVRGLNQRDIEAAIVDKEYNIHQEMFFNYQHVLAQLKKIIYEPDAPITFHIPSNEFSTRKVELSEGSIKRLKRVEKMDRERAYTDAMTRAEDYTAAITTDSAMLHEVLDIVRQKDNQQSLIFYQRNVTLNALRKTFEDTGIKHLEINGHLQSFFELDDDKSPVFVQYLSGAAAFESKASNNSIYLDLPSSAIMFDQSLGRNARRGQKITSVMNYILAPTRNNREVAYFKDSYDQIVNKTRGNRSFEKLFVTPWGEYGEDQV